MGRAVFPLLFDLRPNYGGGNEENGNLLQKVPCMQCHTLSPALQLATADPGIRPRLLDTHRQVWVSLTWTHCSFLLGSGHTTFYFCVLQESVSPVLCKFWRLYSGVDGDHLQEGLQIAEKRRKAKGKGEKQKRIQLNADSKESQGEIFLKKPSSVISAKK